MATFGAGGGFFLFDRLLIAACECVVIAVKPSGCGKHGRSDFDKLTNAVLGEVHRAWNRLKPSATTRRREFPTPWLGM